MLSSQSRTCRGENVHTKIELYIPIRYKTCCCCSTHAFISRLTWPSATNMLRRDQRPHPLNFINMMYQILLALTLLEAATASHHRKCTKTITKFPGCCEASSSSTKTRLINCSGCSLTSVRTFVDVCQRSVLRQLTGQCRSPPASTVRTISVLPAPGPLNTMLTSVLVSLGDLVCPSPPHTLPGTTVVVSCAPSKTCE